MNTSVRRNLYCDAKNQPEEELETLSPALGNRKVAKLSRDSFHNSNKNWLNTTGTGFANKPQLDRQVEMVFGAATLTDDVFSLALESQLDKEKDGKEYSGLIRAVVNARSRVRTALDQVSQDQVIETLDCKLYVRNQTVAKNLLFGTPIHENVTPYALTRLPEVSQILVETRLQDAFINIGIKLASLMLKLFSNVEMQDEMVVQHSFIEASRFDKYRALLKKVDEVGIETCNQSEKAMLISLTMQLSPAKHNVDFLSLGMQRQIVEARKLAIEKF